jgi:hypothetical protein
MKYELNPYHRNVPEQELLDDLKKVASKLGKNRLTREEYVKYGKYGSRTFEKRFGTWNKALEKSGLDVNVQMNITNKELFENIEKVWLKLGRQPLYSEIKSPLSKYSTFPYVKKFGNWRKALEAFIEFIEVGNDQTQETEDAKSEVIQKNEIIFKHKTKREPSERLKVKVLMRDGNKCKLCGCIVTGDNLHFDHIIPWSKGGETLFENLQVLCSKHNLAKGNLEYTPAL